MDVLKFATITDVTHEDGVDLGDSCHRDSYGDAGLVDFLVDDLDFEGRVTAENFS